MSDVEPDEPARKVCCYCQAPLVKKTFKCGVVETPSMLNKRNYCDRRCASAHKYNPNHTCTQCKRVLSRENDFYFAKSGKNAGQLTQPCKTCRTENLKQWGRDHPEKIAESKASYHQRVWKAVRHERGNNEKRTYADRKEFHKRWQADNKERVALSNWASHQVQKAIKKGILTRPDTCSECGKTQCKIEASHHDYSKPLEVTWLCLRCHRKRDARNPRTKPA